MKLNYNMKTKKILFFRKEQLVTPQKILTFGNFPKSFGVAYLR